MPPTPALPTHVHTGHLERNDAQLWFASFGDAAKPTVLLLHGGGGSSDYWAHLVIDLMRDYHVIVLDTRGHGRSTNEAASLSYQQLAHDALSLLDHLKVKRAALVGWSDGANVAFHAAMIRPENVTALVGFAGNATPAGYQPSTNPQTMAAYAARTNAEYLALSPRPQRRAAFMNALSALWKTEPRLAAKDFASIRAPALILHAEHDEIIRQSHAESMAKWIPNAKFLLLPRVSHFALLQDYRTFNAAVRAFLLEHFKS